MGTDKNQNILEKQLKTLGQKIRIDILKKLKNTDTPISFSKLQKEVLGNDLSSKNLSFHLNTLKKSDLVISSEEGYSITFLGGQIIDKILSIEEILNKQKKSRMIRTSKYSKELFDINKIEEYLVREGELERYLAKQIVREVEARLSKTNIEYMTAPLMREYINAILLENGLEEVRHKLTRLGTPPFEVFQIFNSKNGEITPESFIKRLGSDVSEQFLLLNLLPKNLADLYLSGEIALLHLNYWGLRPLSLYINTKSLINYLFKKYSDIPKVIKKAADFSDFIIHFSDLLYQLSQFYSEDLLLGDFNNDFLSYFKLPKTKSFNFNLITSKIFWLNSLFKDGKSHFSLEFSYNRESTEECSIQEQIDNQFLNSLNIQSRECIKPLLFFESTIALSSELDPCILNNFISDSNKNNIIIYNKSYSNLLNSTIVQIPNPNENKVILDKILSNLHMISVEAKQNDDLFLDLLQDKLNSVFELFKYKEELVQKKLNTLKQWKFIINRIFNKNVENFFEEALKSISFFGLNEAILNHCGIELDRTESSENFALKILSLMKEVIEERNEVDNNNFILSQPHHDSYLKDSCHNGMAQYNQKINQYTSRIIRSKSSLSLNKKIELYKKFQKIINGGTLFIEKINTDALSLQKFLTILFESKIGALSLRDCLF
ncbi:MAG: anaerobic ribonucleoside-triphosphate reductase [Candidatus Hodarchaeota archaeon]